MFRKQKTVNDLNHAREAYNALLQKVNELCYLGLDEAAHAEPVRRSEIDTHPIVESNTVDATVNATVPRRSGDPNCVPKPFNPDAACETSAYDVLVLFLNNFKTASPLPYRQYRRSVPKRAIKKGKTGARVSRRQPSKGSGRPIGLGWRNALLD